MTKQNSHLTQWHFTHLQFLLQFHWEAFFFHIYTLPHTKKPKTASLCILKLHSSFHDPIKYKSHLTSLRICTSVESLSTYCLIYFHVTLTQLQQLPISAYTVFAFWSPKLFGEVIPCLLIYLFEILLFKCQFTIKLVQVTLKMCKQHIKIKKRSKNKPSLMKHLGQ